MVSPPSSRIATSNETRVRVEGLAKTMASVLPASGRSGGVWPASPAALELGAPIQEAAKLFAREIRKVEEVARCGARHAAAPL